MLAQVVVGLFQEYQRSLPARQEKENPLVMLLTPCCKLKPVEFLET